MMPPYLPLLGFSISKSVKNTILITLGVIFGIVVIWGSTLYGVKRDGERQRITEDLDRRATCTHQYDTPECLRVRLKKAELKQEYEKALQDITQKRNDDKAIPPDLAQ